MNEIEVNQRVAEEICNGSQQNGKPFHPGSWVALLDGKVVTVANDLDAALQNLRKLDRDPHRGMVFEVRPMATDVIR